MCLDVKYSIFRLHHLNFNVTATSIRIDFRTIVHTPTVSFTSLVRTFLVSLNSYRCISFRSFGFFFLPLCLSLSMPNDNSNSISIDSPSLVLFAFRNRSAAESFYLLHSFCFALSSNLLLNRLCNNRCDVHNVHTILARIELQMYSTVVWSFTTCGVSLFMDIFSWNFQNNQQVFQFVGIKVNVAMASTCYANAMDYKPPNELFQTHHTILHAV